MSNKEICIKDRKIVIHFCSGKIFSKIMSSIGGLACDYVRKRVMVRKEFGQQNINSKYAFHLLLLSVYYKKVRILGKCRQVLHIKKVILRFHKFGAFSSMEEPTATYDKFENTFEGKTSNKYLQMCKLPMGKNEFNPYMSPLLPQPSISLKNFCCDLPCFSSCCILLF